MSANPHEKLIRMANQISKFMESKPREQGIAELSSHINDFWEPRMREQLLAHIKAGGAGLDRIVLDGARAATASDVIDVQLQSGITLRDASQRRDVGAAGQKPNAHIGPLARRPEPIERAVGPP